MIELKIELTDERPAFEPTEQLAGNVRWDSEKASQRLELRLFWFTRGKGTEDAGIVATLKLEQPLGQESRSFSFQLPEAPYSFSGKLISLVWALELIAYPSKEVVRREFEMAPGKKEIKLDSVPESGPAQKWLSVRTA